jgi:hypothetical protein
MVKGANEIGYDVGMLTNGERISPKDIPMIVDHMMWLRFTFNAPSAATYKLIHDVDEKHFERVKQNIQDIVKAKGSNELPTIGMQMVFDNHNFDEIADGAKLAKEFGVDYYEVKPRLHWNNFGENFTENGLLKLQDELAEIEEGNFPIYIKWNQILPSLKQKSTVKYLKKTYPVCLGHSWNVKITPSGGVEECLHMEPSDYLDEDERELRSSGVGKSRLGANSDYMSKKYIVGNIYSGETFREMWTSEARGKALQELDLANCPVLCRLNPLNEILWQLKVPEKENHISFL